MSVIVERSSDLTNATPMMQQYLDVKANYKDYILMYRLGDFFECFFECFLMFWDIKNPGNPAFMRLPGHTRTGDERIELPLKVLETLVIPFDQSPIFCRKTDLLFIP